MEFKRYVAVTVGDKCLPNCILIRDTKMYAIVMVDGVERICDKNTHGGIMRQMSHDDIVNHLVHMKQIISENNLLFAVKKT